MTGHRAAPCSALHFSVAFGGRGAPGADLGFSEVILPPWAMAAADRTTGPARPSPGEPPADAGATLVLRRGFDGRLDLHRWCQASQRSKTHRGRSVTICLLDATAGQAVATWHFAHVRPLQLAWSSLDALRGGVMMETLTLAFESMRVG